MEQLKTFPMSAPSKEGTIITPNSNPALYRRVHVAENSFMVTIPKGGDVYFTYGEIEEQWFKERGLFPVFSNNVMDAGYKVVDEKKFLMLLMII